MSTFFEQLAGLGLRDPWMLLLLLLVPLGLWLRRRRGSTALRFAPSPLLGPGPGDPALPRSWRVRLLFLPRILQVAGIVLVVLAVARPVERVRLPKAAEGIDVLLCIDASSSMAARDMDPRRTRLELAKAAAARFVAARPDDRIGLIRFARYPDLACPLTLDHVALGELLAGLEMVEADGPEDRTGIGTAVARAGLVLRRSLAASKVVILLTDGEENVATAETPDEIGPLRAASLCEELGVRVYTIAAGIGKRDREGQWVPLDTTQVRELAEKTGGEFYEARDARAMERVYATIDRLERSEFEEPAYELQERFLPFLIAAMLLVLLGRGLECSVLEVLP